MPLQAAEASQRDVERRASSSGGAGASPGQRTISSAFAVSKVHEASVENALGRWLYAAKVPPNAFDHPNWPAAFAAMKSAPNSMRAPRRFQVCQRG